MKKALRTIAVGLTLVMGVSVFAGCSKNEDNATASPAASASTGDTASAAPASPAKVAEGNLKVVTYFTGNDTWAKVWKDVLKDWEGVDPKVKITDEAVPAAGDNFKKKINTDFATGNEPDVTFAFVGADSKPMVDSGKLFAWDDELKNDTAWSSNFSEGALKSVKYEDGKQYGLPYIGYYEGMFYNEELFTKYNVKVPTTYEELLTAVDAFKKEKIVPITVSFAEEPHYLIETFVLSLGGVEGHTNAFDASWAPALDKIKELYEKGAFPENALTIKSPAASQLFFDSKAAMFVTGSWSAGSMKEKDGKFDVSDTSKVMPLPMLPGGKADPSAIIAGFGSAWYVSAPKNEATNGGGVKFVKWLTTPDVLAKFINVGGSPSLKGVKPESATPVQLSGMEMLGNAKETNTPIDSRITPDSFQKIWRGLSQVVAGKTTSEKLLEEAKALNVKK